MTCRKAFDIDLVEFVRDPIGAAFAEFRRHCVGCRVCSDEVRAWTELERQLKRGAMEEEAAHPSSEILLKVAERADFLPALQRRALEEHLEGCPSCRDELRQLGTFDFASLTGGATRRRHTLRIGGRIVEWTRGLVLNPAFAYGLVLLLLVPTILSNIERFQGAPPQAKRTVSDARVGGDSVPVEKEVTARHRLSEPMLDAAARMAGLAKEESLGEAARVEPRREEKRLPEAPAAAPREKDSDEVRAMVRPDIDTSQKGSGTRLPMAQGGSDTELGFAERQPEASLRGITSDTAPSATSGTVWLLKAPAERVGALAVLAPPPVTEITRPEVGEEVTLVIPLPAGARSDGLIEVRVVSADRLRELRAKLGLSPSLPNLQVVVPRSWLSPGTYRVELQAKDSVGNEVPAGSFQLSVR